MKKVRIEMSDGALESNGFLLLLLVEVVVVEVVMVEMKKVLKKRKVAVEGMECHIKNPKKRFLTTISGDVVKDMVTVFVFFVFLVLVLVLVFFFFFDESVCFLCF